MNILTLLSLIDKYFYIVQNSDAFPLKYSGSVIMATGAVEPNAQCAQLRALFFGFKVICALSF